MSILHSGDVNVGSVMLEVMPFSPGAQNGGGGGEVGGNITDMKIKKRGNFLWEGCLGRQLRTLFSDTFHGLET